MKKTMACILTLAVLCAALLTGCGETAGDGNNTAGTAGNGNNASNPAADNNVPETMLPDVNDGIVDDTDGIINDPGAGRADNGAAGGAVNGNKTVAGTTPNGSAVTGTAANVRSNGMTVGTRAAAYR